MSAIINISIDLTKIDKTKLKDGKYLNAQISINNETKYGNNVSMSYSQTKEQRESKEKKTYIANGKVVWTDGTILIAEKEETNQNQTNNNTEDDGLPF